MKLKYDFLLRDVGDRVVAVAVGEGSESFQGIITMNRSSKAIFELLREETSEEEILKKLMEQYEGTEAFFREEIGKMVLKLRNGGVLSE
ncbi:MAG: PqqD family protein [Lachnospiraceae bacterium]|nr:PqqD family protein [Lachnospiraceae bacterium]MBO4668669.1 PqqD family protein [Lachnospiraceae bacterium]